MTIPGLFDFGLDLSLPWEGFVEALVLLLAVLLFLVRNCLEDKSCQAVVVEGRSVLEEVQDSISETECNERLDTRKKRTVPDKEKGPPGGSKKIRMGEKTDLQGQKLSDTNNKKKGKNKYVQMYIMLFVLSFVYWTGQRYLNLGTAK